MGSGVSVGLGVRVGTFVGRVAVGLPVGTAVEAIRVAGAPQAERTRTSRVKASVFFTIFMAHALVDQLSTQADFANFHDGEMFRQVLPDILGSPKHFTIEHLNWLVVWDPDDKNALVCRRREIQDV